MARRRTNLSFEQLRELARSGAEAALKQLRAEIIAIERTFPELALPRTRRAVRRSMKKAGQRRLARRLKSASWPAVPASSLSWNGTVRR